VGENDTFYLARNLLFWAGVTLFLGKKMLSTYIPAWTWFVIALYSNTITNIFYIWQAWPIWSGPKKR
jgi:hypothetical protein